VNKHGVELDAVYRHYKGGLYRTVDVAQSSVDESLWVVYRPEAQPALCWTRPLEEWSGVVIMQVGPKTTETPRFALAETGELSN